MFEDKDLVGVAHGGETVGDDEASPLFQEAVEGFLNQFFGGVVVS